MVTLLYIAIEMIKLKGWNLKLDKIIIVLYYKPTDGRLGKEFYNMSTREKLLNTSNKLFLEHGYDNVSIKNITDAVGIAKATFYHHFKSKDDVLKLYLEGIIKNFADNISIELKKSNMTTTAKLNKVFEVLITSKLKNVDFIDSISNNIEVYNSTSNYVYVETLESISIEYFTPIFSSILKDKKSFYDEYDIDKISKLLLKISFILSKENANIMMENKNNSVEHTLSEIALNNNMYFAVLERILGLDDNSLNRTDSSKYYKLKEMKK